MTVLKQALSALGWSRPAEQVAMIRLLAYCGKGTELFGEDVAPRGVMVSDAKARTALEDRTRFTHAEEALQWLADATQELFYTPKDYRDLKADAGFFGAHRADILPQLALLGLNEARAPKRKQYDFLLVPGGNEEWAELRMEQLRALAENGVRAKNVVLLGSTRLLMPEIEAESIVEVLWRKLEAQGRPANKKHLRRLLDKAVDDPVLQDIEDIYARNIAQTKAVLEQTGLHFADWPTEADMLPILFDRIAEQHPAWRDVPCHIVNAPMVRRADGKAVPENTEENIQRLLDGSLRRANTHDTLQAFAALPEAQKGDTVLSVSHQPYALHQHGQLQAALQDAGFQSLETVSERTPLPMVNVHHALGCIAKYIYAVREQTQETLRSASHTR
jgi:hypothetical protein